MAISAKSQNFYLDTLPQMKYQHGISIDLMRVRLGYGLVYHYNFWGGLGYRNYHTLTGGLSKQNLGTSASRNSFGFEMGCYHHLRFGLKRLFFFTVGLAYKPFVNFSKSDDPEHDNFVHHGMLAIGLSGFKKRFHFEFLAGPSVYESKQDLYTYVHTFAQISFEIKLRLGIFFGERRND